MKTFRIWPVRFKPPAAALASLPLFASLALLTACDRLAGTEVGNPEVTVAARFAIHDTDSTATVPEMNLKVMGMGWTTAGQYGACWNEPDGRMVDFVADAQAPLPEVTVKDGEWSQAEMTLQAASVALTLPDSAGFAEWSNPRYIKLVKTMGKDTVRALFRLSGGTQIKLGFTQATVKKWRSDKRITVSVLFDAGKWAVGLGSDPSFTYRLDGKHARYVVLAPDENAAAYEALKALLPQSFLADAADML